MAFLVYRASAGSGKTYTLVRNYLLLALGNNDPAYFRHILAITFTNKAANEMKSRVLKALHEIAGNAQENPLANDLATSLGLSISALQYRAETVFKTILHRYQDFSISTIDAFVAKIGRSFARDLQLQQGFEITLNQQELSQQAVEWLLAQIGQDEALTETLINFSKAQTKDEKNWDIRKSLLEYTQELFRDETLEQLQALSGLEYEQLAASHQQFLQVRQSLSKQIKDIATEMMEMITHANLSVDSFSYKKTGFAGFVEKCLDDSQNWKLELNKRFAGVVAGDSPLTANANSTIVEAYASIETPLLSAAQKLLQIFEKEVPQLHLLAAIDNSLYATATMRQLRQAIEQVLDEQQATTLGELYHRIGQLLKVSATPYIYERIGNRYRHFLIDEFQDTSLVQWQNLAPLVDNGLSEQQFSLLVGDPKQAIYRWRSGEAGQFVQLPNPYGNQPAYASFITQYEGRNLSDNYRSGETIIEFNNQLFSLWSERLHPDLIPYYTALTQQPKKAGGYVQVQLLENPKKDNKKKNNEPKEDESEDDYSYIDRVMPHILAEIRELYKRGFAYGDMAILVRKNKTGAVVAQRLLEAGLEVMSSDSLLMGKHLDLQLLVQCIRWLYTNDPLAEAALHQQLTQRFADYPGKPQLFFKQKDNNWQARHWLALPLYTLGERLVAFFELNKQSDPFLLALLDQMHHFSKKPEATIDAWLDWWDNKGQETAIDVPEALDAVRIMTFHKAKGLEFPVVFLPETHQANSGNKPDWKWIRPVNSPLPLAMVKLSALKGAPPAFRDLYEEEQAKKALDYLNMLYVACTRATTAMFIYGQLGAKKNNSLQFSDVVQDLATATFEKNQASWGQLPDKYQQEQKNEQPAIQIKHNYFDWQAHLRLSTPFNPTAEADSPVQRGRIIHQLLAGMRQLDDWPEQMQQFLAQGLIAEKEAEKLTSFVNNLRSDASLAPYFDPEATVLNEHALLGPGIHVRPDRLVIKDQKAWILEYKTGQPLPQHQQQLDQYLQLMEAMGYEASGRLLYFETEE
jgi:ATP-dependent exoDNAse (exonuclease V) beta subunit